MLDQFLFELLEVQHDLEQVLGILGVALCCVVLDASGGRRASKNGINVLQHGVDVGKEALQGLERSHRDGRERET